MVPVTSQQLQKLTPNARDEYKTAFAAADGVLAKHGINNTSLRLAHFMAQCMHETGGLTILRENLNYSVAGLMATWPKRFPTVASAQPFAHRPQAIADFVYNGRMGNNPPHDGSSFIGRGLLQITGRESYEKYGNILGIDLAGQPDLATDGAWTLKIAAEEWFASNCNKFADQDEITKVTQAINGGQIGIASRRDWLVRTKNVWN